MCQALMENPRHGSHLPSSQGAWTPAEMPETLMWFILSSSEDQSASHVDCSQSEAQL